MIKIAALAILLIFCAIGFIAVFFTTFGTLIILAGAVIYAALTGFSVLTAKTLIALFILYLIGEIFENAFVIIGAKGAGATNAAVFGAITGGILGAAIGAVFFGIGLIPGTFLGIFLGSFLAELLVKRDVIKSLKAGTGSVLGRAGSIAAKILIAIIMFLIMALNIINSFHPA